jgi:low affinity Fe/Cu permease
MTQERTDAAESREKNDGLDPFEKFVEISTKLISRAPFFAVVVAIVVIWGASYPLWKSTTKWELAIHTFGGVLSLLLLVLLENAGRRNTEAMQEKLNVLAEALAALMEAQLTDDSHELREAIEDLREAVGLEERH